LINTLALPCSARTASRKDSAAAGSATSAACSLTATEVLRAAVAIDERQTATAGRQMHRQRRADAFGGAGHDGDAVSERKCHRRFSFDENIQACHTDTLATSPNPTPASFPP
jgi:hypothetical protein